MKAPPPPPPPPPPTHTHTHTYHCVLIYNEEDAVEAIIICLEEIYQSMAKKAILNYSKRKKMHPKARTAQIPARQVSDQM